MLDDQNLFNKVVFVVRYYGNNHLGPVRFQLISAAAKTALAQLSSQPVLGGLQEGHQQTSTGWQGPIQAQPILLNGLMQAAQPPLAGRHREKCAQGYASVTSPQPFTTFTSKTYSWGSRESLAGEYCDTPNSSENMDGGANFHPRASSLDLSVSGPSYSSVKSGK